MTKVWSVDQDVGIRVRCPLDAEHGESRVLRHIAAGSPNPVFATERLFLWCGCLVSCDTVSEEEHDQLAPAHLDGQVRGRDASH